MQSIGQANRAQTGTIKNVLLLKDGSAALTCGMDGTVCLWDIQQARIVRRFVHEDFSTVYCMALIQDERILLAAGSGPGIAMWDIETGELKKIFPHERTIYSLSTFRDEQSFLVGDDAGHISQFRLDSDARVKHWRKSSDDITALRITPDQSGFISGNGDGNVNLWKLAEEKSQGEFEGLTNWVCCLRYSDDGSQLFGSDYSGNVALWDAGNQKQVWQKESLASDICWGHFVGTDQLVVVDTDDAYYLLDRKTGKATRKSIVIPAAAGFDLSPDETTMWAGGTNLLCGWDLQTARRVFPDDDAMQFAQGVESVVMRGGRIYVSTGTPRIAVWDAESGKRLADLEFKDRKLPVDWNDYHLVALRQGLAICSSDGIVVTDYDTGEICMTRKKSTTAFVKSVREGYISYISSDDTRLVELDLRKGGDQTLVDLEPVDLEISNVAYIDEHHVAMLVNRYPATFQIWSLPDNKVVSDLTSENDFAVAGTGQGLLVGRWNDTEIAVFASPRHAAGPLDSATASRLMDNLGSDSYAVRQEARQRLITGGQVVSRLLDSAEPASVDLKVQIRKIRQEMAMAMLPDLKKPLKTTYPHDDEIEVICADRKGRFFLVSIRDGWKSELMVCVVESDSWSVVRREPLRSRASRIVAAEDNENRFVIGYLDGTLDVIQIETR